MSSVGIADAAFIMVPVAMTIGGVVMLLFGRNGQRGGGHSGGGRYTRRKHHAHRAGTRKSRA